MTSSDEDDDGTSHAMRFSHGGDYEDGQWINGEFYARGGAKRGKMQTKEEQVYGVFGDEQIEAEQRRGRGRGRGRGRPPPRRKAMAFVSGGTTAGSVGRAAAATAAGPGGHDGLGRARSANAAAAASLFANASSSAAAPQPSSSSTKLAPATAAAATRSNAHFATLLSQPSAAATSTATAPQKKARRVGSEFAAWEKGTKGFGSKLLAKWGWKKGEGGGKNKQGVAQPMVATVRPDKAGIGLKGVVEAHHLEVNKKFEADFTGKEEVFTGKEEEEEAPRQSQRQRLTKRKRAAPSKDEVLQAEWRRIGVTVPAVQPLSTANLNQSAKRQRAMSSTSSKPKYIVSTSALRSSGASGGSGVIDMRGPVAVTHASAAAAVAAEEGGIRGERGPASTLGRELLYNLAQLRELSAAHHLSALQRRDALAADLGAKRSELAAINHDAAKGLSARGQRTAALLSALDEIQDGARSFRAGVARARPGAAARAQIELCDRLHSVRKRFAPEWERQQMWRLVCATAVPAPSAESSAAPPAGLAEPLLRACAQEWSLESESVALSNLQKSSRSGKSSRRSPDATRALAASLRPWHALLCSSFAPGASGFLDPLEEAELTDLSSIFDALVESCILPRLRRVAAKEWRVKDASSNAPMVHAMHSLLPLLADAQIEAFALDSLLPKLAREVEAWDPLRDTTHLHAWLLPWHSFFVAAAGDGDENENVNGNASEKGKKKGESVGAAAAAASFPPLATLRDTIFPKIRRRLVSVLRAWSPSDDSALEVIAPWRSAFSTRDFRALLNAAVVPKLAAALAAMRVDPWEESSSETPLTWLMEWVVLDESSTPREGGDEQRRCMAPAMATGILNAVFFPRWLRAFATWLADGLSLGGSGSHGGGGSAGAAASSSSSSSSLLTAAGAWYRRWRDCFSASMLACAGVRDAFGDALDLIDAAVAIVIVDGGGGGGSGSSGLSNEQLQLQLTPAEIGARFLRAVRRRRSAAAGAKRGETKRADSTPHLRRAAAAAAVEAEDAKAPRSRSLRSGEMLSLKQALTAYAEQHGVLFTPLGTREVAANGARLYSLGGTAAYIASGVLFVQRKNGAAKFDATAPESAVQIAAAAAGGGGGRGGRF